jgi:TRAP-type C4-dicarboxylate transport system permease small subunit
MFKKIERGIELLAHILAFMAFVALILMALHVTASVALRWAIGQDIPVTTEMATYYYMVALTYLPLAFVDRRGAHLNAEFFYVLCSKKWQRVLDVVNNILAFSFLSFLAWRTSVGAYERTLSGDIISTASGHFPIWPARWFVPIGLGVAALIVLLRGYEAIKALWEGDVTESVEQVSVGSSCKEGDKI